jgi:magnesium-transporting ATPase (P-type)
MGLQLIFRIALVAFIIAFVYFAYAIFNKKHSRKHQLLAFGMVLLVFCGIIAIVLVNVNSIPSLAELKGINREDPRFVTLSRKVDKEMAANNIFKDLRMAVGVFIRIVLVAFVGLIFRYLLKKSRKYPQLAGIVAQRILIYIGFALLAFFVFLEFKRYIKRPSYIEEIELSTYSLLLAGGLFWSLLVAIVSAAALPEDYDERQKN